jgi:hypothetical protein
MARKYTRRSKGLGDTVEKVLEVTGVAEVAKAVLGDDCGCDKRKRWLNVAFPYAVPMNEVQKTLWQTTFANRKEGEVMKGADIAILEGLYADVLKRRRKVQGCGSCLASMLQELQGAYEASCDS